MPVFEAEEEMLSGRLLKVAWYMENFEARFRLTELVSEGLTKKEAVAR